MTLQELESRAKRQRMADDYYPTPSDAIVPILRHLPPSRVILDPCAGNGDLLRHFPGADTAYGIEKNEERAFRNGWLCADALAIEWPDADLCVLNPPFTSSQSFVEKALSWKREFDSTCESSRTVAALVRLTFLESAERKSLHQTNPADVYVLSRRPRFRSDTIGTDSVTAAWFVWGPGRGGRWCVL